jgi:predicted Zn-ribbon and HTH transcriptional regulator
MHPQTKLSTIASKQFNVFGYCPQCGSHKLINAKKYSRFTLGEMNYKARCPKCKSLGIDISVVKLKP